MFIERLKHIYERYREPVRQELDKTLKNGNKPEKKCMICSFGHTMHFCYLFTAAAFFDAAVSVNGRVAGIEVFRIQTFLDQAERFTETGGLK